MANLNNLTSVIKEIGKDIRSISQRIKHHKDAAQELTELSNKVNTCEQELNAIKEFIGFEQEPNDLNTIITNALTGE